jgi:PAS domain S-box-containing protein
MAQSRRLTAVNGVVDSEGYLLDDVEWLERELGNASPGRESNLMRLLLSRVTWSNMFQFCALLDAQGTMWDVNQAALRGAGLTRNDIHGRPFWQARWWQASIQARKRLRAAIKRAARGKFVRYDVDIFGRERGAELITIDFNIKPVTDRDGTVRFLICEGRDVTEQRRLEREVMRQREELAKLDELKTQFFANISHEFRTPLTLMLGPAVDALADTDEPLGPRQRERITTLQRNGLRLLKLVNTLLDFSRLEAGRVQAIYEPTDLATLTIDLAGSFRAAMDKADLRFVVDCPPLDEPVYIDRDMWEKIVLNLLSNAFKFTLEGEVELKLSQVDGQVGLMVRDTGTGLREADLPNVFDRFHRVEGARGRSHEGSGIGLALVQELAKLHGGSVRVESEFGRGSAFVVSIPLGAAHLPADHIGAARSLASTAVGATAYVEEALRWLPADDEVLPSEPEPARAAAGAKPEERRDARVLVADDNADMRDYLHRLLAGAGYQVEPVSDGLAALAAIRRSSPDLVISDVMMPKLDGFALLHEIRADPATAALPVVLLSARAGEAATVEGLESGADDYLVKPFTARELLARVDAHVTLARLRGEATERERDLRHLVEETLDRMSDAFYAVNRDLRLVYANRRLTEWTKRPWEELKDRPVWEVIPDGSDPDSLRRRFGAMGEARAARFETFSAALDAWIEGSIHRSDTGYSVYLQDVTIRKRMEEELHLAKLQAEAAALARSHLLEASGRDLRQPLEVIRISIDGLERTVRDHEQARGLARARLAADVIADAFDKLVEVAKLDGRLSVPNREVFAIRELLERLRETWAPLTREKRIGFELGPCAELVHSDQQMLGTILDNLVGNAIRYTERGRVWVECHATNDTVAIEVHDTGIGIPEDRLDDIFKEFQRLDPGSVVGMGLGLSIVMRTVALLGHRIAVQSEPGAGSCFQVAVPRGSWRHMASAHAPN